jgi:hypothetical protein
MTTPMVTPQLDIHGGGPDSGPPGHPTGSASTLATEFSGEAPLRLANYSRGSLL